MGNLVDYAKNELKRIGMIDSGEPYNDWATEAILDLIELFASQDHSGFSATYVASMFHRLAMFKPVSPLTGEDDEWIDLEDGLFQNKRYSAVFKDKDGTTYNIEGKVFTDDGEVWYISRDSRVNVTFPYVVPDKPEYIYRNNEEKVISEALKQEPKWIPVTEKLPDEKDYCLCCDKDGYITIGFISQWSKEWCFDDPEIDIDVVAWMPLPPCYEPQESEE